MKLLPSEISRNQSRFCAYSFAFVFSFSFHLDISILGCIYIPFSKGWFLIIAFANKTWFKSKQLHFMNMRHDFPWELPETQIVRIRNKLYYVLKQSSFLKISHHECFCDLSSIVFIWRHQQQILVIHLGDTWTKEYFWI